ncbi:MAG: hypothetical protein AB1346_08840 [Thermodesulfobacteriota bacterium]
MGEGTVGRLFLERRNRVCLLVAAILLLPIAAPAVADAMDLKLSSRTYGLIYERERPGGTKDRFAPLFEYLSTDLENVGGKNVSFHFYGWGRVDLADDTGTDGTSGEIGSAYAEYLHPEGNAQAKLGRFFLTEGAAMDTIDGAFVKMTTPVGLGVSLFGGIPVEYSEIPGRENGDSLYGGRVFFARSGRIELGVSYLKEEGSIRETDRELFGGDLWLQVIRGVELTGQAFYNDATHGMAYQRYALRVVPGATVDVSAGFESYDYKDLFGATLNPAFAFPFLRQEDDVNSIFAIVDWEFMKGWTLEVVGKRIMHDLANPGDATRGEVGLRHIYNKNMDVMGFSTAFVAADLPENEYREFRAFGTWSREKLRLTLDALAQDFEQRIAGKALAFQVVGTAGYRFLKALQLSGSLIWTDSPTLDKDVTGLVRLSYDLSATLGGKK